MLKKVFLIIGVLVLFGVGFSLEVRGDEACRGKEEMDDCTTADELPGYCSWRARGANVLDCKPYSTGPTYEICTDANSPHLGTCRSSCVDGFKRYPDGDSKCPPEGGDPSLDKCCSISVYQGCNPLPKPCGIAAGCLTSQICKNVPGIGFNCEQDSMGVCEVNNCRPPSQCFKGTSNCPEGWMRYILESCGEDGLLCCRPKETDCPSPAECLRGPQNKVCPETHTLVPGTCPVVDGVVKYCCQRRSEDPEDQPRPWWENPWAKPSRDLDPKFYEASPEIGEIGGIITTVINYLFPIAGLICLIFIIQGGYMWIASGGNPENTKRAQGTLTWAIIGLLLTMTIFGILTLIINFLY